VVALVGDRRPNGNECCSCDYSGTLFRRSTSFASNTMTSNFRLIVQAVVLGTTFDSFAHEISVAHAEERATAALFPIVERIRICMLGAEGILSLQNASSFFADRNQLSQLVFEYRYV